MFLDSSVVVAIVNLEEDGPELEEKIKQYEGSLSVSPLVVFEATQAIAKAIRVDRRPGRKPTSDEILTAHYIVRGFIGAIQAQEVAITSEIGDLAIEASMTYGKFVGHKAALNFGDCFSYACAKAKDVGLLYKGNDFALTDLA